MINYNELQKQVFNWLKEKKEKDQNFNFSLRRKATKGAEQNYFIGTEKSKYFSTTFWNIPVAYPGSAGELVSLVFDLRNKNKLEYSIQFNQTKDPHDKQNKYALELIKKIKPIFLEKFPHANAAKESNKMEYFSLSSGAKYDSFSELILDLESTLTAVIPLVDQQITLFKKENPDFIAHKISEDEHTKMLEKMGERLKKHEFLALSANNSKTAYFNTDRIFDLTETDDENVRADTFEKLEYLKEQLEKEIGIKFTSANHLKAIAKNPNSILEIRFQPLDVKDPSFEIIMGFGNEDNDADYESKTFFSLVVDCYDTKLAYSINEEYGVFLPHRDFPDNWKSLLELLNPKLEAIIKNIEILNISPPIIKRDKMNTPVNQILYGPPGTGKTYNTINKAISIANPEFDLEQDRKLVKLEYSRLVEAGQIMFTTFHQSMSYEEFIEGIKPETKNDVVIYDIKDGIFKIISDLAQDNLKSFNSPISDNLSFEEAFLKLKEEWEEDNDLQFPLKTKGYDYTITGFSNKSISFRKASGGTAHTLSINTLRQIFYKERETSPSGVGIYYPSIIEKLYTYSPIISKSRILNNFILIIDEINRGNVSQIFGELITLIEGDKRIGNGEELQITLPYSKEKFGVPPNLFIIGTMNTADRSVEALDSALRRRFVFEEMPPLYHLEDLQDEVYGFKLSDILKRINLRIEKLLDSDHAIGHAYFLHKDENSIIQSFYKNIIPLLKEYFFGDHGKIGLVLGDGFVQKIENDSVFAEFEYDGKDQYDEKESYLIMNHSNNQNAFQMALSELMK